jgi:hypothetical protein
VPFVRLYEVENGRRTGVVGDLYISGTSLYFRDATGALTDLTGAGPGGASAWGDITGTLADQTDLDTALDGKQPLAAVLTGTTASFTTADETKLDGIATGATVGAPAAGDYLVGTADAGLSAEIVVGTSPGGELGGTWASPTLDDTVTVTGWTMGASVATTPSANDNDTSLATSAYVQSEIDDVDLLSDNCVLENDATPIPDSCIGDGSDAGAGGGAPTTVDYLVGTADAGLSAEIVVGTTPGGELGGTWASPTVDDTLAVTNWTLTSPTFAAGSASANSWPKLTSGTVLTTAEEGAIEVDDNVGYLTTDAGNRGYLPATQIIRADSTRTLPSDLNANPIFNSPANGRITLETGTYRFEGLIAVTAMSGTSGNAQILFGGTGTFGSWLWKASGIDGAGLGTIAADLTSYHTTNATAASVVTAQTSTNLRVHVEGTFECTVAGTFIPQIDLVTAAAGIVSIGSFIAVERIGSTSLVSVGQWD